MYMKSIVSIYTASISITQFNNYAWWVILVYCAQCKIKIEIAVILWISIEINTLGIIENIIKYMLKFTLQQSM